MKIVIDEGSKYCIRLEVTLLGEGDELFGVDEESFAQNGMSCLLTGGECPHVGGMAMVSDEESHMWQFSGHRDAEAAMEVAQALHEKFGVPVAVTAGIHIDNATKEDIQKLQSNWIKAVEQMFK